MSSHEPITMINISMLQEKETSSGDGLTSVDAD
jgi:hypothetical protein